jgi:hypothetical protein
LQRLLFFLYVLLWPPFFILVARTSEQPEVAGRWSYRMALILATLATLLLCGGVAVLQVARQGSLLNRGFASLLVRCRTDRRVLVLLAGTPPVVAILAVVYAGMLGVVLTPALITCLVDLALIVLVWEALLLFAKRSAASRKRLLQKTGLAAGSTLLTIAALETVAGLTGLGGFVGWDINPGGLDVRMTCDEFDVGIVTNSQGLRESAFVPAQHPDRFRVVVVGDSMTFGWGVEHDETYVKIAERRLRDVHGRPDIDVINMGRPGANPVDYLRFVRQYAAKLQPDAIVVGFGIGNDCPVSSPLRLKNQQDVEAAFAEHIERAEQHDQGLLKYSFLLRLLHANLYRRLATVPPVSSEGMLGPIFGEPNPLDPQLLAREFERADGETELRRRYEFLKQGGWIEKGLDWRLNPWLVQTVLMNPTGSADALAVREKTLPRMRREWLLCEKLLAEIKSSSEEIGTDFLVIAIPQAYQVTAASVEFLRKTDCDAPDAILETRRVNDWLNEFCRQQGVVCVDPLSQLRGSEERAALYYPEDGHLTPQGQAVLGEMLAEALKPLLR